MTTSFVAPVFDDDWITPPPEFSNCRFASADSPLSVNFTVVVAASVNLNTSDPSIAPTKSSYATGAYAPRLCAVASVDPAMSPVSVSR